MATIFFANMVDHTEAKQTQAGDGGIPKTPEVPATYSEGKEIETEKWEKVGP